MALLPDAWPLCEVGSLRSETPEQRGWRLYQEAVRATIREQWEDRETIQALLDFVQATHRDAFTVETLERTLRLGTGLTHLARWARGVLARVERSEVTA